MYYLILDTETTNSIDEPLAYDLGFSVIDEKGNTYESFSFAIADVFLNKELMSSAYYAKKIPTYWEQIHRGERQLKTLENVRRVVLQMMNKYNTNIVVAHNARFDALSMRLTERYITKSKYRYFFPYGTKFVCTLKMARKVFNENEEYCTFCVENGYLTKYKKNRFTAEILYRFLSGDNSFEESHIGFEDTEIERIIFARCLEEISLEDGLLW